jgi:hypothetical protein
MITDYDYGVQHHFNSIAGISWRSVLLVDETGVPREREVD